MQRELLRRWQHGDFSRSYILDIKKIWDGRHSQARREGVITIYGV